MAGADGPVKPASHSPVEPVVAKAEPIKPTAVLESDTDSVTEQSFDSKQKIGRKRLKKMKKKTNKQTGVKKDRKLAKRGVIVDSQPSRVSQHGSSESD